MLVTYGTGAIMAVPGGDERDYDFAQKYDLPIIPVVAPPDGSEPAYVAAGAPATRRWRRSIKGDRDNPPLYTGPGAHDQQRPAERPDAAPRPSRR